MARPITEEISITAQETKTGSSAVPSASRTSRTNGRSARKSSPSTTSTSRKSGCATISRDSEQLLKRKPRIRQTQDSDLRYLWAAYRLGFWADAIDAELSQKAFEQKVYETLGMADYDWIVDARQGDNIRPVGLILAHALPDGRRIEPHVDWFPWATPRNKLEGLAAYLRDVGKRFKILVYVEQAEQNFWERLKQYRLLRHGCKIIDYFDRGEHAFFFYTVGL
jgi:hypothetical protein